MNKGPIWPFLFTRLQVSHQHSILKTIPGLEIATDIVANATNISSLATKNSG